jgi:hypothetical protein
MREMDLVSKAHPGWSLTEIKDMTRRERHNWLELNYPKGG